MKNAASFWFLRPKFAALCAFFFTEKRKNFQNHCSESLLDKQVLMLQQVPRFDLGLLTPYRTCVFPGKHLECGHPARDPGVLLGFASVFNTCETGNLIEFSTISHHVSDFYVGKGEV